MITSGRRERATTCRPRGTAGGGLPATLAVLLALLGPGGPAAAEPPAGRFPILAMPGRAHVGPLPPLTADETALAAALESDVRRLALDIGQRHPAAFGAAGLRAAEEFLHAALVAAGYEPERQAWETRGVTVANLVATVPGGAKRDEIVVVGGHYDTVPDCPGANDNGSGTAATLALARRLAGARPARTLRFCFFVNEEPPWFQTDDMGSLRYARRCRDRGERIVGMLSLETMGYYSDAAGSQRFDPFPPLKLLYPDAGNFIAFVSDVRSGGFASGVVASFRKSTRFPAHGLALPDSIEGIGWSDHWSFAQAGFPAAMVTDTAAFRYPHYHAAEDTPDKLDFPRMARVVAGLERVVGELVETPAPPAEQPGPGR
jgi:hypothetical protein